MFRWLVIATMGLSLNACSSDDDDRYERKHHHHGTVTNSCSTKLSCGTCTPVVGCGWCQFEDGSGRCATGPGACGETFRWNWNPEDCPSVESPSDAGSTEVATPADAEADVIEPDAVATDAVTSEETSTSDAPAETSVCAAPSSVPAGCAQSFGGTLCGTGQYTLGCSSTVKPGTSLGCTAALTEGGTTHYCCRCD